MKSVAAFAPYTTAPVSQSLNMAAAEAASRRAFVQNSAALAATAVPGWFANFNGHSSGCQCGNCAHATGCSCGNCSNNHAAGCSCGACGSDHSLGCQCANCMVAGPLSYSSVSFSKHVSAFHARPSSFSLPRTKDILLFDLRFYTLGLILTYLSVLSLLPPK